MTIDSVRSTTGEASCEARRMASGVAAHIDLAVAGEILPDAALIERTIETTCRTVGVEQAEVSVRVVAEDEGRELNRRFRGKDIATNVLSFPFDDGSINFPEHEGSDPLPFVGQLGDVVICAPVVAREAEAQGKPFADHFIHLTVHGVLHLAGYDHLNERDACEMESLECRILSEFDILNPYVHPITD